MLVFAVESISGISWNYLQQKVIDNTAKIFGSDTLGRRFLRTQDTLGRRNSRTPHTLGHHTH